MKTTDVGERVLLDGELVGRDEVRVSPWSDGFMFGHGLFETIKVLAGRAVFFPAHAARLERSARELKLSASPGLAERCQRVIEANGLVEGVLKIVMFQSESGVGELILVRKSGYAPAAYTEGFKLKLFSDERVGGKLGELKTLNYLKNSRAKAAAREAGFDEALFVNQEGAVLEGASTNVFVVKDGIVFTPHLQLGILPGVARAVVLEGLGEKGARETLVTEVMLDRAEEIFVTNSLVGVMPVTRLESRGFELRSDGLTRKIQTAYREAELRSIR